jgi:choline dehydrogenase-like flavoprotein
MAVVLTEEQRQTITVLIDTFVPAVAPPPGIADPHRFYARTGTEVVSAAAVEYALNGIAPELAAGLAQLVQGLTLMRLADVPAAAREATVASVAESAPEAALGIVALRAIILSLAYSIIDETGTNPFWATIGYPAPGAGGGLPHALQPEQPPADGQLSADAVVVGSGAGGGVIAAELAAAGLSVVVLEAGGYFDGESAIQYEVLAAPNVFYRGGGFTQTAEGNVNLWAGATLGGGTTINWSNCVRTPEQRRREWAFEHGLTGLDGPAFDEHLDAVLARIGANEDASVYNGPHRRLLAGAERLGWSYRRAMLNLDPKLVEADRGALLTYGDRTGAKQGTVRTYLVDAAAKGARIFIRTHADSILVRGGRAVGVTATHLDADGNPLPLTVHARTVVVACGALETPALLLRSRIGGPAVGRYLHLHPSILMSGRYAEAQNPWEGPIQSALVDELTSEGILIECVASQVGATAATLPWRGAAEHKHLMAEAANGVPFVAIVADHGSGRVTIDADGNAVHLYPVEDERDRSALYQGMTALARLHQAAGAQRVWPLTPAVAASVWTRGSDLDAALAEWRAIPLGLGGHYLGTAHQMGSARMGTDPASSVAKPTGELHDVPGVWIGDTSAFPTTLGVNPMVTCMALARRTAGHIVG